MNLIKKNSQIKIDKGRVKIITGPGTAKNLHAIDHLNKEKKSKAYIGSMARSPLLIDGPNAQYTYYTKRFVSTKKKVLLNYIEVVKHKKYKFIVFDDIPGLENDFEAQNSIICLINEHLIKNNTKIVFITERGINLKWLLESTLPKKTFTFTYTEYSN